MGEDDETLPIWLGSSRRLLAGVTRGTTCDDVVRAFAEPRGHDPSRFVLVERWRRVERPLEGGQKILRLWRRWGYEQRNVRLLLRTARTTIEEQDLRHRLAAQGETLATQRRHLRRAANQIEVMESNMHRRRAAELGENYVQDAYLGGNEGQVALLYERVSELCRKLEREQAVLGQLTALEALWLTAELEKLDAAAKGQKTEEEENDRAIQECEGVLAELETKFEALEAEERALDSEIQSHTQITAQQDIRPLDTLV